MHRFELELAQGVVERRDAGAVEPRRESCPLAGDAVGTSRNSQKTLVP